MRLGKYDLARESGKQFGRPMVGLGKTNGIAALIGAHMSIAGGTPLAIDRGQKAGCKVLQIFVKNNNRWQGKILTDEEVDQFRSRWSSCGMGEIVAHNCYLINLASPVRELRRRSIAAFVDEMDRCERLGLSYLVTHPGSHVGAGEVKGIRRIARSIDEIHARTEGFRVRIALETTAGQGTSLGHRFEHLRDILAACRQPEKVFVCLDTCHIFAAGYDFRQKAGYRRTIGHFDRTVGLDKIRIFHFNDSKKDLGSRVDRHEHIGQGKIGSPGFAHILKDFRFAGVPKILETPKPGGLRDDRRNLARLRSMLRPVNSVGFETG